MARLVAILKNGGYVSQIKNSAKFKVRLAPIQKLGLKNLKMARWQPS
jgi:hypothetical protein